MQSKIRYALALAGIAVLIVAALVLSSGSGESESTSGGTGASGASAKSGADGASDAAGGEATRPKPAPLLRSGEVVKISVRRGEMVRFRARSETADELHIHGYDRLVELPAGETVRYQFKASLEGVFEIELHGSGEQLAELRVDP